MTTQYAVLKGLPNGLALDAGKLFTLASPDTVVTGNTFGFSNRTNANTQYVVSIVRATPLPAGDYTFIAYIGSSPKMEIALTFLGTDGETATETARLAELDSATQTQITNIENAAGYTLAVLAGTCADPQTASETYAITVFGSTFTVDMAGQDSTGTRTAPTLTKT